jgi:hypothetical protein
MGMYAADMYNIVHAGLLDGLMMRLQCCAGDKQCSEWSSLACMLSIYLATCRLVLMVVTRGEVCALMS